MTITTLINIEASSSQEQRHPSFQLAEEHTPSMLLVGVGGCGCSAVEVMAHTPLAQQLTLAAINTDHRELSLTRVARQVPIGKQLTKGLGAGAQPEIARQAALESRDALQQLITGYDLVLIIAGGGGGTGTGAPPVLLELCEELAIPSVAVVVMPFAFEGRKRRRLAQTLEQQCRQRAGTTFTFENDALLKVLGHNVKLEPALDAANQHINDLFSGLIAMIDAEALAHVDFSHLLDVLSQHRCGQGTVLEGSHYNQIKDRLLSFPLLAKEDRQDQQDKENQRPIQVLYHIWAPETFSLGEFAQIGEDLSQHFHHQADITAGLSLWQQEGIKVVLLVAR